MNKATISVAIASASLMLVAFAAHAASFSCLRASAPDEKAICADASLSQRDDEITSEYRKAATVWGRNYVAKLAHKLLAERRACGADAKCIVANQDKTLMAYAELQSEPPQSADFGKVPATLPWGNKNGMQLSVIKAVGIGGTSASIQLKQTPADAQAYCREWASHGDVKGCMSSELTRDFSGTITANCATGDFVNLNGEHLVARRDAGELRFKDASGEDVEEGSASGFFIDQAQFGALCPD